MKQGPYFCRFPLRFQFEIPKIALTLALSFEVLDIVSTQGPLLFQLLLPRMLGAAARGEDAAQALDAQHQVLVHFCHCLICIRRIARFPLLLLA